MAKSISSIVSNLGLVMSIITNLVNRVVKIGGSEECVRLLANPENPVLDDIAETVLLGELFGRDRKPLAFKNWPTICAALRAKGADRSVVWANALADPQTKHGQRLALAFPEFWSQTEVQGPIPLSLLQEYARTHNRDDHREPEKFLVWNGAIDEYNIPCLVLDLEEQHWSREGKERGHSLAPPDIKGKGMWEYDECVGMSGKTVTLRGSQYVVVEVSPHSSEDAEMYLVPLECIALDL